MVLQFASCLSRGQWQEFDSGLPSLHKCRVDTVTVHVAAMNNVSARLTLSGKKQNKTDIDWSRFFSDTPRSTIIYRAEWWSVSQNIQHYWY